MPLNSTTHKIRLSAQDTMGVVDLLTSVNIDLAGMSQASAVRIALTVALESFRERGIIPRRSDSEFDAVMAPFNERRERLDSRRAALQLT